MVKKIFYQYNDGTYYKSWSPGDSLDYFTPEQHKEYRKCKSLKDAFNLSSAISGNYLDDHEYWLNDGCLMEAEEKITTTYTNIKEYKQ